MERLDSLGQPLGPRPRERSAHRSGAGNTRTLSPLDAADRLGAEAIAVLIDGRARSVGLRRTRPQEHARCLQDLIRHAQPATLAPQVWRAAGVRHIRPRAIVGFSL